MMKLACLKSSRLNDNSAQTLNQLKSEPELFAVSILVNNTDQSKQIIHHLKQNSAFIIYLEFHFHVYFGTKHHENMPI